MGVKTISYFFSIYFQDELSNQGPTWKSEFDIAIRKALTNLFEGEPILHPAPPALGIPEEIINDIPLISLVSKDRFHECSATKKKINFNWTLTNDEQKDFNKQKSHFKNLFAYAKSLELSIQRIAVVANYSTDLDNIAAKHLQGKFLNIDQSLDIQEATIRYVELVNREELKINNITEFSAAYSMKELKIKRDINTYHLTPYNLSEDNLFNIFSEFVDRELTQSKVKRLIQDE
ncbi:MAG: hypothetical protein KGO93_02115 [Cyanobacteria bacterium REEB446]|nr:hypothetical protein [Cyanobacteria bacterium REEB446]